MRGKRCLYFPKGPNRICTLPGFPFNRYRELFSLGQSGRSVVLSNHFHPAPTLRTGGPTPSFHHSTGVYNEKFTLFRRECALRMSMEPNIEQCCCLQYLQEELSAIKGDPGIYLLFLRTKYCHITFRRYAAHGQQIAKFYKHFHFCAPSKQFPCPNIGTVCVSLQVLRVLNIKIVVPWDVIQFSLTDRYQLFRKTYYFQERNPPIIYGWDGRNTAIQLRIRSSSPKTDSRLNRK